MKRWMTIAWVTVALAMAVGCNRGRDTAADAQKIQDTEKQWNVDMVSKDADKIASYYADDAVLMAPRMAPMVGRESIRAAMKQLVADPAISLTFKAAKIEVAESGDLGYTRGAYVMTMTDPQTRKVVHDEGSYVTTYRKQADGTWKAVADISSSEVSSGVESGL